MKENSAMAETERRAVRSRIPGAPGGLALHRCGMKIFLLEISGILK